MANVRNLTKANFHDFIKENEVVVVAFVLPFLQATQRFSIEYEASILALDGSCVQFAIVDCSKESELVQEFLFSSWPTLRLFRGLKSSKEYEGPWTVLDLVKWMKRLLLPNVLRVNTNSLQPLRDEYGVVVLGSLDAHDHQSYESFTSVARELHGTHVFGFDENNNIAHQEQVETPSVIIFTTFGSQRRVIRLPMDGEELRSCIEFACEPVLVILYPETHVRYIRMGLPIVYAFIDDSTNLHAGFQSMLAAVARKHVGKILFGILNVNLFDALADELCIDTKRLPALVIKDYRKGGRFPLSQESHLSLSNITAFIESFAKGDLKPIIKSEPVSERQDGPVTVVVGSTYADLVINNSKDVLLDYYTQWCGPCKAMYPQYEELARLYASDLTGRQLITIAKVDAEANDVPGDVRGFPTFFLFPAGSKESPIQYDGSWMVKDFARFIRDNGTHKVDVLSQGKLASQEQAKVGTDELDQRSH